mgnify:CR=1 FL=1
MSDDEASMSDTVPPEPAKQVYDQAFFLDLARPKPGETQEQVRERWNAWRRDPANADVAVTFEGVDFQTRQKRWISFEEFEFGDWARFDDAKFGDYFQFTGVKFGKGANFEGAAFGDHISFESVIFDFHADFSGSTFGDQAQFRNVTFDAFAQFDAAVFGGEVQFYDATFGPRARFLGTSFCGSVSFDDANFDGGADFSGTAGNGDVATWAKRWSKRETLALSGLEVDEQHERERAYRAERERRGAGPAKFSTLSFAGAHFRGDVGFARRSFERPADFTGVRFDVPPDFDGATNLQRIDFTGAHAGFAPVDCPWWKPHWTTDSTVAVRLRALRSQIEATKNHDFERDLYIEERKAERGIYFDRYLKERRWAALAPHCLWIGVMAVYWAFSDYGRSWLRPAIWLGASIPAFHLLYAHLLADRRGIAVASAREAVTKTGEGKDALVVVKGWQAAEGRVLEPCRPIPPPGFQAAMISQNLLSILLVFFIGLALRNYFRVK